MTFSCPYSLLHSVLPRKVVPFTFFFLCSLLSCFSSILFSFLPVSLPPFLPFYFGPWSLPPPFLCATLPSCFPCSSSPSFLTVSLNSSFDPFFSPSSFDRAIFPLSLLPHPSLLVSYHVSLPFSSGPLSLPLLHVSHFLSPSSSLLLSYCPPSLHPSIPPSISPSLCR